MPYNINGNLCNIKGGDNIHYLDNAATTKVDDAVIQKITNVLKENFGNPSSLYSLGMQSEIVIKNARQTIANALKCDRNSIYFTSCGTESNNIALLGAISSRTKWADNVICTGFEHPSVEKPLANCNMQLKIIPPNKNGIVDVNSIIDAVNSKTALVSVMHVNNEIGTIQDVVKIAELVKQKNLRTAVHVDGIQAFLKLPIDLKKSKIDTYSLSGHKVHAPKGIGALYIRSGYNISPPFLGGGQEKGIRSGTENIAYIAGFAKAVELLHPNISSNYKKACELITYLKNSLENFNNIKINSPLTEKCSPYIFNFSCVGYKSEVLLHYLEDFGIYVSSGSACSKGKGSHTLVAMGLENNIIDSSLRIGISNETTIEDINIFIKYLDEGLKKLAH